MISETEAVVAITFCVLLSLPAVAAPTPAPQEPGGFSFGGDALGMPGTGTGETAQHLFDRYSHPGWHRTQDGEDLTDGKEIIGMVRHQIHPEDSTYSWIAVTVDRDEGEYVSIGNFETMGDAKAAVVKATHFSK